MAKTPPPTAAGDKGAAVPARAEQCRSGCTRVGRMALLAAAAVALAALLLARVQLVGDGSDLVGVEAEHVATFMAAGQEYRERYERYWPNADQWAAVQREKARFEAEYSPAGEYGIGGAVERAAEQSLRRLKGEVYLDYTGASLYQEHQLRRVYEDLASHAYGNAHSKNPSAARTEDAIYRARRTILQHFNVSGSEYSVIFTSGATAGLKLIAESFPWTNASTFVYLRQNHNSVLGIREIALDQGARFVAIPESEMNEDTCNRFMGGKPCFATSKRTVVLTPFPEQTYNLFAFPAQDNFAGAKYPLDWINMFRDRRRGEPGTGRWLTLLDAAAYVPTNRLDLSKYPADFVVMSFYKIFGYPTGLGALLVRNEVTEVMQKTFFGGGTVVASSCDTHFCLLHRNPCTRFEDGTVSFLGIAALKHGFEEIQRLGIENITRHVWSLARYGYDQLSALRHSNGSPVLEIYGNHHLRDPSRQGGILNFNVKDPNGVYIGYATVQEAATAAGFHVRAGCHCNPGACYGVLNITSEEIERYSLTRESCGDEQDIVDGRPLGTIRSSIGYLTTFEDLRAWIDFIKANYVH